MKPTIQIALNSEALNHLIDRLVRVYKDPSNKQSRIAENPLKTIYHISPISGNLKLRKDIIGLNIDLFVYSIVIDECLDSYYTIFRFEITDLNYLKGSFTILLDKRYGAFGASYGQSVLSLYRTKDSNLHREKDYENCNYKTLPVDRNITINNFINIHL
jgi:hypothetical protein